MVRSKTETCELCGRPDIGYQQLGLCSPCADRANRRTWIVRVADWVFRVK